MTTLIRQLIIPSEWAGARFDKVATVMFSEYSRVEVSKWIREGSLTLNNETVLPKLKVKGGEEMLLNAERSLREVWQEPQDVAFDVVFEDEDVIVINKPAGLVVHPGAGNPSHTLVNGLLNHRAALKNLPRAGVVHRLDKDTSGLMVVAASPLGLNAMSEAVSGREMSRQYLAICEGRMIAGQDIDVAIGRDPKTRTRHAAREDGKPAFTEVRVEERFRLHTLVRAKLSTGRTHQIRVHLAHVGYPLVGDSRYGARRRLPMGATQELRESLQHFPRQALHATRLAFKHPRSGDLCEFSLPVPDDMAELLTLLKTDVVKV